MQPGVITLSGFLGSDPRELNEIIADDERTLSQLEIAAEELANRMQYFTDKSFDAYETPITIDEFWQAETEVVRGKLPCPFGHAGIQRKTITILTDLRTGQQIRWTALNIHMIKAHGFFEGKGSPFRLEPALLKQVLFL